MKYDYLVKNVKNSRRKQGRLLRWGFTIVMLLLMTIPTDLFFVLYNVLDPVDFWQKFAVILGGIAVFGVAQGWFIVIGFGLLVEVIWK